MDVLDSPPPLTLLAMAAELYDAGTSRRSPRTSSSPSTCGRPTPRATSPRSPPAETVVMMELRIEKLKRRDLRHLLPIEAAVFPEPWSVGVFNSELALRHGRLYRAAWHEGRHGRLHRLHDRRRGGAHDHHRHRAAPTSARGGADAPDRWDPHPAARWACGTSRSRWRPATSRRRRSTGDSGSPRWGVRKNYYPITGEDALVMWAYDIDTPDLRPAARGARTTRVLTRPARPHPRHVDVSTSGSARKGSPADGNHPARESGAHRVPPGPGLHGHVRVLRCRRRRRVDRHHPPSPSTSG